MHGADILAFAMATLGGLALFIYGMNLLSDALRAAAGDGLRRLLAASTRSRLAGLTLGTVIGTLVQSSATTVMCVGFVNAGLMTLAASLPVVFGANVGTSLSMQLVSFRLTDYALAIVAAGFALSLMGPGDRARATGRALLGFGLVFLGLKIMAEAIGPHRDALRPMLAHVDGRNWAGMLSGVAVSMLITGILQSSGAVIGMVFALIAAGAITSLAQAYPVVLGAHIGTCVTALIGSAGTSAEARRSAVAHLLFNVGNVALAMAAAPLLLAWLPHTSPSLVRQVANLHTVVMSVAAILFLPFIPALAAATRLLVRSRQPSPVPSFLDPGLLAQPEAALDASLRELRRVAEISGEMFDLNSTLLAAVEPRTVRRMRQLEQAVDDIKAAMKDYLAKLARQPLTRGQGLAIQSVESCMIEIERIADHADALCDIAVRRARAADAAFDAESSGRLRDLLAMARDVLRLVSESLDPATVDVQAAAGRILAAREFYAARSLETHAHFTRHMLGHGLTPMGGLLYSEFLAALDRAVRHTASIALAETHGEFSALRHRP